jgi:hypothetical protein
MASDLLEEIKRLANCGSILESLKKLEIIPNDCESMVLEDERGWYRSGSETFLYTFRVRFDGRVCRLVLKACVAFATSATDVEEILGRWIRRRHILAANNISTPKLYGWGNGVLLEEYIPYSLSEALNNKPLKEEMMGEIGRLIGAICKLGFSPVRLFDDLRSRGDDVVMVDFGEDLGEPGTQFGRIPFESFSAWVRDQKLSVNDRDLDVAKASFLRTSGEFLQ